MSNIKNIALIGLGGISQSVHLPVLSRLHDQVRLSAVVDLSPTRTAEIAAAYGDNPSQFHSVDALLAADVNIDGAIIATGGTHAADTKKLLAAGIPVLSEKPLAYSLAEHAELEGIATADNLRIGYMKEYDPASRAAKKAIQGLNIRSVEVEVLHPADAAQLDFANLRPPAADVSDSALAQASAPTFTSFASALGENPPGDLNRFYPNVVLGSIVHDIALLRYLLGGIGTVTTAEHFTTEFPGSLFFRGALRDHAAPWTINWHFIADYPQYRETVTIHHDKGTVRLVFDVPYLLNAATELEIISGLADLGVNQSIQTWPQREAFETEWKEFLNLIDEDPKPGSSLAESAADIKVGQLMTAALSKSLGYDFGPETEVGATTEGNIL